MQIAEVIKAYRALRDRKAQLDAEIKEIKADMQKLENVVLAYLQEQGLQNVKTPFGTAFQTHKERWSIKDWDSLKGWIQQTGNLDVLSKRLATTAVRELEEEGVELPGVEKSVEIAVQIRK